MPLVDLRRDPRFTLEDQWINCVLPCIEEAAKRGLVVTPLTVFNWDSGKIEGWLMHGWKPPPPIILWPIDTENQICEDKK